MKVLIIEDDISFVTELRMLLEQLGITDYRSESTEGGAVATIIDYQPDLVICDVNLHGHNSGVVLAEYLSTKSIPFIIVTQYNDEDAYFTIAKYSPLAYFSKPLDVVAFGYTVSSLSKQHSIVPRGGEISNTPLVDYMFVRKKSKYEKVNFVDVLFIQAEGNYLTIQCVDNKYVVRSSLKKCLERLSAIYFQQIHRNYVINIHRLESYNAEKNTVAITDRELPVGRSFKSVLKERLPLL